MFRDKKKKKKNVGIEVVMWCDRGEQDVESESLGSNAGSAASQLYDLGRSLFKTGSELG